MNRREFFAAAATVALAACHDTLGPPARRDPAMQLNRTPPRVTDTADPIMLGITSHLLHDSGLRLVRELGFTHIRSTLISTRWAKETGYARAIRERTARVAGHGLGILYVVHNDNGKAFRLRNDPAEAAAFTEIVEAMVKELPEVEAWQLWNEMDVWQQAPFGAGANPPESALSTGVNYGRWWRHAYPRLKAVRPEAWFVTGATADHTAGRWRDFLRGMVRGGLEADAITFHVYGDWARARSRAEEVRSIVGESRPLWMTEFSAAAGRRWSSDRQAEAVRGMIEGNERERVFNRMYAYCLETDPNDPWYGLHDPDGTERPLLEWLRARQRLRLTEAALPG